MKIRASRVFNGNVGLNITAIADECSAIFDYCLSDHNLGNRPVYVGCTPVRVSHDSETFNFPLLSVLNFIGGL